MTGQVTYLALSALFLSVVCFEVNALGQYPCNTDYICSDQNSKKYLVSCATRLQQLHLVGQNLSYIRKKAFQNNMIANTLDLESNLLTTLPQGVFENLGRLTMLSLNKNPITTLPAQAFEGLTNLQKLYMNHLLLRGGLESTVFGVLKRLKVLSLHNSSLTTLPMGIFDNLTELTNLDLGQNQQIRGLSPLMLANNNKLTNTMLWAEAWAFTLDSIWQQCGVMDTKDWRYTMGLDFRTKIKVAMFGDRTLRDCNGRSLVCLPGKSISFHCSCPPGQTYNGSKCILSNPTKCGSSPFPNGNDCDIYPTCTADGTVGVARRISDQCTCPPNTILVPNPCPDDDGKICANTTQNQCMNQKKMCNRRMTHICVCAAETNVLSCIPRGSCSTGPLKKRYPTALSQKVYISNGDTFQGSCNDAPGTVKFTCNNGQISVVEECSCSTGSLKDQYPMSFGHKPFLKIGESFQGSCNGVMTPGPVDFKCNKNGQISVEEKCNCDVTPLLPSYPETLKGITLLGHGQSVSMSCGRTFPGDAHIACSNGKITVNSGCGCPVDAALKKSFPSIFSSPATMMRHNQTILDSCPQGGTIAFTCKNKTISISNNCQRIKCGASDFVHITLDNITQVNAAVACQMVGAVLPDIKSMLNKCSTRIGSHGANLLWLQKEKGVKTLLGYSRRHHFTNNVPTQQQTTYIAKYLWGVYTVYIPNQDFNVMEGVDDVGYVCQFKLKQFHCNRQYLYLEPTHSADGSFTTRNHSQATKECTERGLYLPHSQTHALCTQQFLQKVSNGHRWSAWLRNSAGSGNYDAVDTQGRSTYAEGTQLSTTICTTL